MLKEGIIMNDFIVNNNEIYKLDKENKKIAYAKIPPFNESAINILSVVVDPSLRGQGLAGKLMEFTYNYLKDNNKKAVLTCPYAIYWFNKNPIKKDVLLDENLNVEACVI